VDREARLNGLRDCTEFGHGQSGDGGHEDQVKHTQVQTSLYSGVVGGRNLGVNDGPRGVLDTHAALVDHDSDHLLHVHYEGALVHHVQYPAMGKAPSSLPIAT